MGKNKRLKITERDLVNFVKPLYKSKDSLHNYKHIINLKKNVKLIKKYYKNIDQEILMILVYFHGLKDWINKNKKVFLKFGLNKKHIMLINRHTKNPKTIEEQIVFDANLLDNLGKSGIKKCLRYGNQINRSKQKSIIYLKENISNVKFFTKIGKEIGKKELKIMEDFILKNI